jgi:hypothetical protein
MSSLGVEQEGFKREGIPFVVFDAITITRRE